MRPVRSLFIYFVLVFLGGALLAPWLYWLAHVLAAHGLFFEKLSSNPFHRFVDRALLGAALLGLWPLLRSCRMLHWRDLGLKIGSRSTAEVAFGFLLGFGSLACVALLAILLGGRSFNATHSSAQIMGHVFSAALAAIIVAILEELLFRGALFGVLRKTMPWQAALVVSSAVYSGVHFIQSVDQPGAIHWYSGLVLLVEMFRRGPPFIPAFLTLFVAGACLALAYQRTGALYFSIGLHAGWIFWLSFYKLLTRPARAAHPSFWGTDKLIDGWLAFALLAVVLLLISRRAGQPAER